jgi:uncharacterized protein
MKYHKKGRNFEMHIIKIHQISITASLISLNAVQELLSLKSNQRQSNHLMEFNSIIFLTLLFLIAALYASVGHGGASGYLALMALFHFSPEVMRSSALILNVLVSLIAAWQFSNAISLNKKLFLWLIAGSIPAAFVGATITVDVTLYKHILGVLLLFQALRLIGLFNIKTRVAAQPVMLPAIAIGITIGLLSGIIGIGGGIILSPLLLLLGWADIRQTALISALFIFVNSIAGIAGLYHKSFQVESTFYIWIGCALIGGLLGAWLGRTKFSSQLLTKLLGVVLLIAGLKLVLI